MAVFASGLGDPETPRRHPDGGWLCVEMAPPRVGITHVSDDGTARQIAPAGCPNGLCIDAGGSVWVADTVPPALLHVTMDGTVKTALKAGGAGEFLQGDQGRLQLRVNGSMLGPDADDLVPMIRHLCGDFMGAPFGVPKLFETLPGHWRKGAGSGMMEDPWFHGCPANSPWDIAVDANDPGCATMTGLPPEPHPLPRGGGGVMDLTHLPPPKRFEALLQIPAPDGEMRLFYEQAGYAMRFSYDADLPPSLMIWISDQNRDEAPFDDSFRAIGIEIVAGTFEPGPTVSNSPDNPIARGGIATTVSLGAGEELTTISTFEIQAL